MKFFTNEESILSRTRAYSNSAWRGIRSSISKEINLLTLLLALIAFYAPPVWSRVNNLGCDDVPLGKIIQAPAQIYDSAPGMAYYYGGSVKTPPPNPIPANHIPMASDWCGMPWVYQVVIYMPYPRTVFYPQGNTANYPGTSIPVNEISDKTCLLGNPCSVGTGGKQQEEIDYLGVGEHPLSLKRMYRSSYLVPPLDGFSSVWMHEWQRRLDLSKYYTATPALAALRADGATTNFALTNGVWIAADDKGDQIIAVSDIGGTGKGFRLQDRRSDRTEDYDAAGRLILVKERNGWMTSLNRLLKY